jgi:CheY-like chemotaxis protein
MLTSEEKVLLNRLVEKGLRETKAEISSDGVAYKGLEDILSGKEGQSLRQLLNSLTKKGFLNAKEKDRAIFCSKCGSIHIYSKLFCPKCKSKIINQKELIEHPFCGYMGERDTFISGSSLVCPNCKTNLGPLGGKSQRDGSRARDGSKKDYKILGSNFECEKCGNKFPKPDALYVCQKCDTVFNYNEARYERIDDYEIPEKVIKLMQSSGEKTVLLIEDNSNDALIITRIFERSEKPLKIEHVSSGREGLLKITEKYFDVILLDYKLPEMNGIEILKEIRERKIRTPIIMLTGADDRRIAVEAMKLGASDFIVKSPEAYQNLPSITQNIIQ